MRELWALENHVLQKTCKCKSFCDTLFTICTEINRFLDSEIIWHKSWDSEIPTTSCCQFYSHLSISNVTMINKDLCTAIILSIEHFSFHLISADNFIFNFRVLELRKDILVADLNWLQPLQKKPGPEKRGAVSIFIIFLRFSKYFYRFLRKSHK